jgi:hypothetical protein
MWMKYFRTSSLTILTICCLFIFSIMIILPTTKSALALEKSLTVESIFADKKGNGVIEFNGTSQTINGTDEQLTRKYFDLAKAFYVRQPQNTTITFMYSNGTTTSEPFTKYDSKMQMSFFKDILSHVDPFLRPKRTDCWVRYPDSTSWHYAKCPI